MRTLILLCTALLSLASPAGAQSDASSNTRWAQYLRDSLPGVPGALWDFKVVGETRTRLELKESGGRVRVTLTVRLMDHKCLNPALDFERPPTLGSAKVKEFSVGYREGAAPTLATLDACAALSAGGTTRYLRVTGILDPERDRPLVEASLAAIFEAARGAPNLVEKSARPSPSEDSARANELQRLESELRTLMQQEGGSARAQKRVDLLNQQAKKKVRVVDEEEIGALLYASVGWRTWLNNPSRVPKAERSEDETPALFERLAQAWNINVGAIRGNYFAAASVDFYAGDVRDATSPGVYQLVAGFGGAARSWSEGGMSQIKSYSYEPLTQFGTPCPKYDKNEDPIHTKEKFRGVKCNKVRVTEHTNNFEVPPGWIVGWTGLYGGWRYAHDMLGGESGDEMRPLGSGGGPVIGGTAFFRRVGFAVEVSHELAYYVHGLNGRTGPAYNGRVGFGTILALMDLRWRLDSAVGKEFMFGLQFRADLFEGVGFWSK